MQYQRVAHAVDVDALSRHPDTQLWHTENTNRLPQYEWLKLDWLSNLEKVKIKNDQTIAYYQRVTLQ